jgi:NAD(P)-dependent dehydrogenase (short-subunit alcohol dehydrogenase family)
MHTNCEKSGNMQNKIIVVTGAAGALGKVVTRTLSDKGALVSGLDLAPIPHTDALKLALEGIDLADEAVVKAAFETVARELGGIDGLVNIAGGFTWEGIEKGSVATWDRLYSLNVRSALLACQAATPFLRERRGSIVNIGANAATRADVGMGAYAASKSGVARLTEALAAELKDDHVRVNAVLPSIIDTPLNRAEMPDADFDRWVQPEALAKVIAFLQSADASAVTGALIPVTGRL